MYKLFKYRRVTGEEKKIIIYLVLGACCTGCTTDTTNRQELEPSSNTVAITT